MDFGDTKFAIASSEARLLLPLRFGAALAMAPWVWARDVDSTRQLISSMQHTYNTVLKGVEVGKTLAKVDENIMQKFFKKEEAQKLRICLVDSGSSEDRARQKALGLIWVNHHFPYC